jgi:hypothetical protein
MLLRHAAAVSSFEETRARLDLMNAACPSDPCSSTTSLSEPTPRVAQGSARRLAWPALACSSLCTLALTMISTSCLVVATPDFTPPERTRPFLVVASADPDPRSVLLVNTLEQANAKKTSVEFSADVVSEDQGAKVKGYLYFDYGKIGGDHPYGDVITQIRELPASTMSDPTKRNIRGKWNFANSVLDPGCHTMTLIVSHDFDAETSCPVCRNDSSQLTWPVFVCDPTTSVSNCHPDFSGCKDNWGQGCGAVADPSSGVECGALP